MGNCAAIQVGSYVDTCVGKPCSTACPTNACPSPGDVCVNGNCIGSVTPTADCSLISNKCTMSCIDKASCQECPSKPGCIYTGNLCIPECYTGEWCDAGVCKKIAIIPVETGCPLGCAAGEVCYNGICTQTITPITTVPPEYDVYGCNKDIGETWCAARAQCHIEHTDPCNPIVPVTPDESIIVTPAGECDGLNRNGSFDFSCLMEKQNQMMLILGVALLGGFVLLSSGKGK
jgi:hypothetical protein